MCRSFSLSDLNLGAGITLIGSSGTKVSEEESLVGVRSGIGVNPPDFRQ